MTQGFTDLTTAVNNLTTAVNNATANAGGSGTSDADLAPVTEQVNALTASLNTAFPPPAPAPAPQA